MKKVLIKNEQITGTNSQQSTNSEAEASQIDWGGRGIGTQKVVGLEGKEGTDYPVADM